MSDQHRGAWGAREDAVWWPGAIQATAEQNNLHHQQIINQHHQQNHMQQQPQQQIHQVVVQQQPQTLNDLNRSNSTTSTVATQQLFSYKMASSFPSSGVTVSTSNAPAAYDYRLGMNPQGMTTAPGTQWWYATAGQNTLENLQQQQQQHQQVPQQQNQPQQQQHQTQHNVHSTPNTVSDGARGEKEKRKK
jgi:high mobility group protein B1